MYLRNMVGFKYVIGNILHKVDTNNSNNEDYNIIVCDSM
jgi:hypothetical protein